MVYEDKGDPRVELFIENEWMLYETHIQVEIEGVLVLDNKKGNLKTETSASKETIGGGTDRDMVKQNLEQNEILLFFFPDCVRIMKCVTAVITD